MVIKVLGSGCPNCKRTKVIVTDAVAELGVSATIVEVTEIGAIMAYGVMSTPAIVIDERVVGSGGVPTSQEMLQLIQAALALEAPRERPRLGSRE